MNVDINDGIAANIYRVEVLTRDTTQCDGAMFWIAWAYDL
jgi:hypothetical protein